MARLAKRIGLLMDMAAEAEISKALNSSQAKLIKLHYGRLIYEIQVFGVRLIAVCSPEDHVVVTFLDMKRWSRKRNCRRKRHKNFSPKEATVEGEEE